MENLGKKGRDKITGFEGVITAKIFYLYGCAQYAIVPKAAKDKVHGGQWFDEGRIEIIGKGVDRKAVTSKKKGGPPNGPRTH